MRIYATTLFLSADRGPRPALSVIAAWITGSERRNLKALGTAVQTSRTVGAPRRKAPPQAGEEVVSLEDLRQPGLRALPSGASVEVAYAESGSPYLHAIRYSHRDRVERGRSWVTEVGLRAASGAADLECSVYLYTDDVSTRVAPPALVTRPMLVRELLRRCAPTNRTSGLEVIELTSKSAPELSALSRSSDRLAPMVIVSPSRDGQLPVNLDRLQDLLAGLATVISIPPEEDTRRLAAVFGDGLTPYGGAVAVLFPVRPGPYSAPVPVRRLLTTELEGIRASGKGVEEEIFSLVTERMNVPNARRHLSLDAVNRERARRSIARHAQAGASMEELAAWNRELTQEVERLEGEIKKLESEAETNDWTIAELSNELDQAKEQLHGARNTAAAHQAQLSVARGNRGAGVALDLDGLRRSFERAMAGGPTPEDALNLVGAIYADRVVILESAIHSSRASAGFSPGAKVLDLLLKLAGPYWEALSKGQPDAEARKAFPTKRFAAKEANLSASGRDRRTFTYKGMPVFMEPHLKAGDTGGSPDTTLRIHFHWDPNDRRVVIGHCGPHIPF